MRGGLIVGLGGDLVEDLVEGDFVAGFGIGNADVPIFVGGLEVETCNLMVATTTGTGGNENHKGEYFEQNKIK